MPTTPLVALRDVSKSFGSAAVAPVLAGVSLTAETGDFVSLIGPSGCGKSTLLRLIAGLLPVSTGALTIGGNSPGQAAPDLAFVFQEPTLLPWLTVAENIELPQKLRRASSSIRARDRALELVQLSDKANTYPRALSGGQKMRVSLARALSVSPKLLLLDEPFGALDEMTREHLNEELLAIHGQQKWTAFFVTHSVAEAVFLSTKILVMSSNPGRIHETVPVALPFPRNAETRLSKEYLQLVASVSRALRSVESPAAMGCSLDRAAPNERAGGPA
jgi:NitT/TauT family transport system ATP-binding protein